MSKSFVRIITSRMKEKNLGVRQLARECGIDASFISKIIQGKRNPPSDDKVIKKLAQVLSVDPVMLTIYTGRIPSVIQPVLEDEMFVKRLLKKPLVFEGTPPEKKSFSFSRPVAGNKTYQKSELTDELL